MAVVKKSNWKRNVIIGFGIFVAIFIILGLLVDAQTRKRYREQATIQKSQDSNRRIPFTPQFPIGPLQASLMPKFGTDLRKKETKKPFNVPALFGKDSTYVNRMCGKPIYRYITSYDNFFSLDYQSGRYLLEIDFDTETKKAFTYSLKDTAYESFEVKSLLNYNKLSFNSSEYALSPLHSDYGEKIVKYYGVEIIPRSSRSFAFGKRQQALMRE